MVRSVIGLGPCNLNWIDQKQGPNCEQDAPFLCAVDFLTSVIKKHGVPQAVAALFAQFALGQFARAMGCSTSLNSLTMLSTALSLQ